MSKRNLLAQSEVKCSILRNKSFSKIFAISEKILSLDSENNAYKVVCQSFSKKRVLSKSFWLSLLFTYRALSSLKVSEKSWKVANSKREMYFLLNNLNKRAQWDYWVFIPLELRTFDTANARHNVKIISSVSFSLANVWLANPIKIRMEKARVGNGVNVGYVSLDQMAWNVINGADRSSWSSVYIWFYIRFSITTSVTLIFLRKRRKNPVFRCRSVKKGPIVVKPWGTFENKVFFVRHFRLILNKLLWWYQINFKKSWKLKQNCRFDKGFI